MRFTHALVCPPGPNFATGLSTAALGTPDYATALAQHEAYCAALAGCGLSVVGLPADRDFPDGTFVEDTAVLTKRGAFFTRPGAPSRAGEVARIRQALAPYFPDSGAIRAPGTLDGGDVCQAESHFFIGLTRRTNEEGARQLAAWLAARDYSSATLDLRNEERLLHLKTGMAYLGDARLAVIPALAGAAPLRGFEQVLVPPAESYAANCVRVNDRVLLPQGFPQMHAVLRARGYQAESVSMSEFQKMDGGLSCLSLRW